MAFKAHGLWIYRLVRYILTHQDHILYKIDNNKKQLQIQTEIIILMLLK